MLMELIVTHLGTYHVLSSLTPVMVYRIMGERDVLLIAEVTVTDWLRVSIRVEATHPQARAWSPERR